MVLRLVRCRLVRPVSSARSSGASWGLVLGDPGRRLGPQRLLLPDGLPRERAVAPQRRPRLSGGPASVRQVGEQSRTPAEPGAEASAGRERNGAERSEATPNAEPERRAERAFPG